MSRTLPPRRLSVAPMLDWTDRHCRFFHRQITQYTWLYTEMVTTGAVLYGNAARHLDFSEEEHPVALQLGGSDPADLAKSAKLAQQWGYDEVNLNCGCPSDRVQKGAFGACLMKEPSLVADCVKAMRDAVNIDVTVKHRIGIDKNEEYSFVRDFIGQVADAGCKTFIVHARNAILKGLSPKENREIPPLRYEVAYQLKHEFPELEIIVNGGVQSVKEIDQHLQYVDGVMIGRQAYHHPYWMHDFDAHFYPELPQHDIVTRADVIEKLMPYMAKQIADFGANGLRLQGMTRHILGLCAGLAGARQFRQMLSDAKRLSTGDVSVLMEAYKQVEEDKTCINPLK